VSDGTAAGTHELTGISGANATGVAFEESTVLNQQVLFNGTNVAGFRGVWVTDGTAAGTNEVSGISGASANGINPFAFSRAFNGQVVFSGSDTAGAGLWVTNGTTAGTTELGGVGGTGISGWAAGFVFAFAVLNGEVLFRASDTGGKSGLWVTNGTTLGTFELTGISGASSGGVAPV
jgi:tetrahydromethanopterin S-methyltransferase subunit F